MFRAILVAIILLPSPGLAGECDSPHGNWLFCEDFEDGGLGWADWYAQSPFVQCVGCSSGSANPARMLLENDSSMAHEGDWSLYMPAEASASYQGASLTYRSCAGEKKQSCTLIGYEQLYYRAWVRLDPDHQKVHHFMSIGGTQSDGYWDIDGNAGCRPNGSRSAGSTVDFNTSHELHFYTYTPDMNCDSGTGGGYCADLQPNHCDQCAIKEMPCSNGYECCWGNHYDTSPRPVLARGRWVCLEMQMKLNTPGVADGEMAYWLDGALGHRETGMYWRDVAALKLNKVWVQHFLDGDDANQSNRIRWDNIIVSTAPIGCESMPPTDDGAPGTDDAAPPGGDEATGSGDTNSPAGDPQPTPGDAAADRGDDSPSDGTVGLVTGCGCTAADSPMLMFWLLAMVLWRRPPRSRNYQTG